MSRQRFPLSVDIAFVVLGIILMLQKGEFLKLPIIYIGYLGAVAMGDSRRKGCQVHFVTTRQHHIAPTQCPPRANEHIYTI